VTTACAARIITEESYHDAEEPTPTPPGEILLHKFLRPLGMTQVEAAQRLRMPLNRLNEIIHGRRGVTADTALRLSNLLDTTPEFWMNLQVASELFRAARIAEASGPKYDANGKA
jgi:addiction module HigA family antidote